MAKKADLEFMLLWKKIHNISSTDEDVKVDKWMVKREREQFFKDAKQYYAEGSRFDNQEEAPLKFSVMWRTILRRKLFRNALQVAALFVLVFSVYLGVELFLPEAQVAKNKVEIAPGSHKAILHLEDGSSYKLLESKKITIKEKGMLIESQGRQIKYRKTPKTTSKTVYNSLVVPRGGQFFIILEDSTKVWLNSESVLRYPISFNQNERLVELQGEAYFEVTKDANRPFIVKTNSQEIRVLGTSFNVTEYPDELYTTTTLVEGSIALKFQAKKELKIVPAEQVIYERSTGEISKHDVIPSIYTSWIEGNYFFQNETLESLFKTLARWYDVHIYFQNKQSKHICFTGSFNRNQDLSNIIKIIESAVNIKIEANEKKLTIY